MAEERPESRLDMARRHVAEAEARLTRQRKIVTETGSSRQYEAMERAIRVRLTMETTLALMRDHLEIKERNGRARTPTPAGPGTNARMDGAERSDPQADCGSGGGAGGGERTRASVEGVAGQQRKIGH
jgi:hypothetical protein